MLSKKIIQKSQKTDNLPHNESIQTQFIMNTQAQAPLVLASSSHYRRQLLRKLQLKFQSAAPDIDESRKQDESAEALVTRLAQEKALALASRYPQQLIIGSDQVAVIDEQILTKPGDMSTAKQQLQLSSGNTVTFLTGLCLYNSKTGQTQTSCERFSVKFLALSHEQIENYLLKEEPYDCAGSFKSEGLGVSLFESMHGDDPNTLIGLPLIALCEMLRNEGVDPLRY